ncbi:DUF1294 domain-containing protein [Intestinimonas butyriciproducens]|uniref:DUF1294 domain-containing protein n=1 Tax=Intestinimonas butyriciproducens TaxID=1297617 RepID=UPI00195CA300|nr:DUF1294 domain-containing protein [Intestinimonas butyriciproducens]MBM6917389.1 DUF1294 domain-containing protein [Intestinimonas butyriciproducens]
MLKALWLWLLLINGTAFALCGVDKWKAVQGQWRVRERTLLLSAALGGSPGLLLAMLFFHHKTRHRKFTWGVPAILVLQIAVLVWVAFQRSRL